MNIPFCKSSLAEEEIEAIAKVIRSGWIVQGKVTQEFEQLFADYVGAKYAIFVDSGTSALDLSLKRILQKTKTDKVCVPSLTFTSTAEVVVHNGLRPCFHDVNKDNFCMNSYCPDAKISIPVHLTGNCFDLPASIYDSAHRIVKDDVKESDALWCYSLYATKNMTSIQGGMIATNNEEDALWLRKARDHGISKGTTERYKDGDCLYSIDFVGWREKSDDVHAAVGIEQLKKLPAMDKERERIIARYNERLLLDRTGLHLYPIFVEDRPEFLKYMKEKGVQCSVHFLPLHKMPAYQKYYRPLPITEYIGDHIVSLPLFPQLTNEEVDYICDQVIASGLFKHE